MKDGVESRWLEPKTQDQAGLYILRLTTMGTLDLLVKCW